MLHLSIAATFCYAPLYILEPWFWVHPELIWLSWWMASFVLVIWCFGRCKEFTRTSSVACMDKVYCAFTVIFFHRGWILRHDSPVFGTVYIMKYSVPYLWLVLHCRTSLWNVSCSIIGLYCISSTLSLIWFTIFSNYDTQKMATPLHYPYLGGLHIIILSGTFVWVQISEKTAYAYKLPLSEKGNKIFFLLR